MEICRTCSCASPKRQTGTSRQAGLRRLREQRPDLHQEVLAGKKSVHRAMIEAGFRKEKTPPEWLRHWWARCTKQQRDEFLAEVGAARG
jgi:hypothetical protein